MNKVFSLGAAVIAALAATTGSVAHADGSKHYGYGYGYGHGYGNGYRPAYAAQAPGRGHYAPARGYWHGGRWIAPLVVGGLVAAAVGSAYGYNNYVAPTYYAPTYGYNNYNNYSNYSNYSNYNNYNGYDGYAAQSYYAPATVSYAAPARSGFDYADANGDGYVSYEEAAAYPHWQRNFGNIDRNRDGYLSRDEVGGWRYR